MPFLICLKLMDIMVLANRRKEVYKLGRAIQLCDYKKKPACMLHDLHQASDILLA